MSFGCHFVNCSFNMGSKWWTLFLSPMKICDRRPSPPVLRIGAKYQWWLLSLPLFIHLSEFVLGNEYRLWNRQEALQQLSLHFPQRWTVWIEIHLLCDCRSGVGRRQPLMQWKGHSTFCHEVRSFHFRLPDSVFASFQQQQPRLQLPDHTLAANVSATPFSFSPSAHKVLY